MPSTHSLSISRPKCLLTPIHVPKITLIGPGPTNMTPRIAKAFENSLVMPLDPGFLKIMDSIKEGLQYIFQTASPYVFCVPGVGQSGLEAAVSNLLEPGEVFLVANHGVWGERAVEIGTRQGLKVEELRKPPGQAFEKEEIKNALELHKPTALFMAHVESSACMLQDIEDIGHLCHSYGTFLLIDAVASVVATPFFMDKWGIDVVYTATQKALSVPPGLAPVALSVNAMNKVKARKIKPTTYYLDFIHIANYWECDNEPRLYHHTCPVSIGYALRESLAEIVTNGLEWYWKRQTTMRDFFINEMEAIGYKAFLDNKATRAPTVSAIVVPDGIQWREAVRYMRENYQLQILGGFGPTTGQIFRIGFIGPNCNEQLIRLTVKAFDETIKKLTLQNGH